MLELSINVARLRGDNKQKVVRFHFDLFHDSWQQIAAEMVEHMKMEESALEGKVAQNSVTSEREIVSHQRNIQFILLAIRILVSIFLPYDFSCILYIWLHTQRSHRQSATW